jgi:hypothetical protein
LERLKNWWHLLWESELGWQMRWLKRMKNLIRYNCVPPANCCPNRWMRQTGYRRKKAEAPRQRRKLAVLQEI